MSLHSLATLVGDDDGRSLARALGEYVDIDTPYGPLVSSIPCPHADGTGVFEWPIANPFALLWVICQRNPVYADFIKECVGERPLGRLMLYNDGTTPGGQIVNWRNREITCWYWTFADFPGWFRKRENGGWLPLGVMRTDVQKQVAGDLSGVAGHVLRLFFEGSFNCVDGILLPLKGGGSYRLRLELAAFMQDGLAHKQTSSIKGAGGLICCPNCTNIMNTDPAKIESDPDMHHYSTAKPKDFKSQSHELFYFNCDRLMESHGRVHPKTFELMEKSFGITFDPASLVYEKALRRFYSVTDHTYNDPMHMLVASGGVGQFEINAFLLHAQQEHNLDLQWVDQFSTSCSNVGTQRLQKQFFSNRHMCKTKMKHGMACPHAFIHHFHISLLHIILLYTLVVNPIDSYSPDYKGEPESWQPHKSFCQ